MRRIFLWACSVVLGTMPAAAAPSDICGKLPLAFEANQGQVDEPVRFLARGPGYTVFLTQTETVLSLRGATVVRMRLLRANPDPDLFGVSPQPAKSNYFLGNDPRRWHTGIPNYARVRVEDVYPGIDLIYRGSQRQLEYDFVIAPGADPDRIRLAFQGADAITLGAQGELILRTPSGDLVQHAPVIYQEMGERRQRVEGRFVLGARREVGFEIGRYDRSRPLIIDPVLSYSTFLGGAGGDDARGIAVDGAGNAYVVGITLSTAFPESIQPDNAGREDVFVTKINAAGTAILYSTFLGGSEVDFGFGIAVDGAGNAYVTGSTASTTFPGVGGGSIQPSFGGLRDAFVTKIDPTGTAILYSTYLGGSGADGAFGIAINGAGSAYVTGWTTSTSFPGVGGGSIQPAPGGNGDAFVTKIDPTGNAIAWSTFLGGSGWGDTGFDVAVDLAGSAYVTGHTNSTTFPGVNASSIQPANAGDFDAFLTKIDPTGTTIVYATFLGGMPFDSGDSIAVDAAGSAHVAGSTATSLNASVIKINPAGNAIVYSILLGSPGMIDRASGIAIDAAGNAYITGQTSSTSFPGVSASSIQPTYGGSADAFVTMIDPAGGIVWSTYLGGSAQDTGYDIAIDVAGSVYVTGFTLSPTFPGVSPGSIQPVNLGGDAFVTKISFATLGIDEIPTLSQWGSISMALLLAAIGLIGMRKTWRQA